MKRLIALALSLLITSSAFAAHKAKETSGDTATTSTERTTKGSTAPDSTGLHEMQQAVAAQQLQIQQLQQDLQSRDQKIQQLEQRLDQMQDPAVAQSQADPVSGQAAQQLQDFRPVRSDVADLRAPLTLAAAHEAALSSAALNDQGQAMGQSESPLSFHIGSASITPVGFMDFTAVWRSRDGGSGIGTNFAGIPYGGATSFQSNLSEFRFSMQNSRIGFRVDADVKGSHVIGYMEADFLGNNPTNVAVGSNSNTLRSRLYWVDVRKSSWELLGGQSWSLATPNRVGVSPLPGDVFFSDNMDVNYQAGMVWGRIPEFRAVYHFPSDKAAFAVALDSPEQYVGGTNGAAAATFPSALAPFYPGGELNNGTTTLGVPNRAPDVISKFVFDPSKRLHAEIGGIARFFQLYNPLTATHYSTTGGAGFVNLDAVVLPGLRLLTHNYWSDGGGRYIFGQAPDLIARVDGSPSLVHSGSTVDGFEFTHKNSTIFAYYGLVYVGRNVTTDTNSKSIGYGYVGAPNGQNRTIQEPTWGFIENFWKDPKYGALSLIGQYSYLTRDPWSVATGSPKNAHASMAFLDLRYTLPGSAPTLGK